MCFPFYILLAVAAITARAPAEDLAREPVGADEELLQSAKVGTDTGSLLGFFRRQIPNETTQKQVRELISRLGDPSIGARVKARAGLLALGRAALPLLREAARGAEPKIKNEAARLARHLARSDSTLPAAAARLLAFRKASGATAVLLEYVPFADDDFVRAEVRSALIALTRDGDRPDTLLLTALRDEDPLRRALAAEVLCDSHLSPAAAAVRKLLEDPDPAVRWRVAQALLDHNDGAAVPVLISLLEKGSPGLAGQAQEALLRLAGALAPAAPWSPDGAGRRKCRSAWDVWWRKYDDHTLLEYFRKRTLDNAGRDVMLSLIRKLGHRSYRERQNAGAQLVFMKRLAVPFLKEALHDRDPEVRARADACLTRIAKTPEAAQSAAHVRLLALRKPPGAVGVLLAFLPFADDETVAEELRGAFAALATREGKADPALLAALGNERPAYRLTAAEALCRGQATGALPAVRKLLVDPVAEVRLHAALALAARGIKPAVAVLIKLLGELPKEQGWEVEEFLRRLAGTRAPNDVLTGDLAGRLQCRAAWLAWWEENRDKIDLVRLQERRPLLGYTLVAQWNAQGQVNDLIELGPDRKPRWKIAGLQYSFDFDVLPGNRLLVPEHLGHRVTERDFKGNILWEYKVPAPVNCQRLPNGNTFIASTSFVVEVDRDKKEVLKINESHIMAGGKAANGQIVILTSAGKCIRYDTRGKELKSFSIGGPMNNSGGLEVLPRGGVIVSSFNANKVVEYDNDGKAIWTHAIPEPGFSTRLSNGNTLITSQGQRYAVEVTRGGKVVWEYRPRQAIWRARRR
jgi:HEAT repeat protein